MTQRFVARRKSNAHTRYTRYTCFLNLLLVRTSRATKSLALHTLVYNPTAGLFAYVRLAFFFDPAGALRKPYSLQVLLIVTYGYLPSASPTRSRCCLSLQVTMVTTIVTAATAATTA